MGVMLCDDGWFAGCSCRRILLSALSRRQKCVSRQSMVGRGGGMRTSICVHVCVCVLRIVDLVD
jgi:hypothetical protein